MATFLSRWGRYVCAGAAVVLMLIPSWPDAGASEATDLISPGPGRPMTTARLHQVAIPRMCGLRPARLVDGMHPDSRYYPNHGPDAGILGLLAGEGGRIATYVGDFTGDGVRDGLILVGCRHDTGSSYITSRAFAYRSDGRFLGALPVGRQIPPSWAPYAFDRRQTAIADQTIRLRVWSYRRGDAHCCPSIITRMGFRWTGDSFQRS